MVSFSPDALWERDGLERPASAHALALVLRSGQPRGDDALPEVRHLIFEGTFGEADRFLSDKAIARPLRQMAYQTGGGLFLDCGEVVEVGDYRRELGLDAAIGRAALARGGTRLAREIFPSPVDQVIVRRPTADKPGPIGFTATPRTPQKTSVAATGTNASVVSGLNSDCNDVERALRFEARIRVLRGGGFHNALGSDVTMQGGDSVKPLIAVAICLRRFDNLRGGPAAATKAAALRWPVGLGRPGLRVCASCGSRVRVVGWLAAAPSPCHEQCLECVNTHGRNPLAEGRLLLWA